MRAMPFTRPTLVAAVEVHQAHGQASFNLMILRLGLENEIPSDTSLAIAKKCGILGRIAMSEGTRQVDTLDGPVSLAEAIVREALPFLARERPEDHRLVRGLARDGFVVEWLDGEPRLRAALPEQLQLPATDDEVHALLATLGLRTSAGHLAQAIDAHTRGDWAAANSQLRTFIESLFDEIAFVAEPSRAPFLPTSENRRALLAEIGFLATDRNEWTADGKNFINGLFKMLHTDGSHPGLSDEDHSTFRLHVVLVTARAFLRRIHYRQ